MGNKINCVDCGELTEHKQKLSALKSSSEVCGVCSRMNPINVLKKVNSTFEKKCDKYFWIDGDSLLEDVEVGCTLLLGPMTKQFIWLTTKITKVIEKRPGYVRFDTNNTKYEFYYSLNGEQKF